MHAKEFLAECGSALMSAAVCKKIFSLLFVRRPLHAIIHSSSHNTAEDCTCVNRFIRSYFQYIQMKKKKQYFRLCVLNQMKESSEQ